MASVEDDAAALGFEMRKLLERFDRMSTLNAEYVKRVMALGEAALGGTGQDLHSRVLESQDAVLVSAYRLVRYFTLPEGTSSDGPAPYELVPGWSTPAPIADALGKLLPGLEAAAAQIPGFDTSAPPFALIMAHLLDAAVALSWDLAATDPEAARHFDHNLAELRERLG